MQLLNKAKELIELVEDKCDEFFSELPWKYRDRWHRLKGWAWYRHTTVKPRNLPHTWIDKDHLLVHTMFEILCRFMEDEKPGERIEWNSDPQHAHAWKELKALYKWWNEVYLPWEQKENSGEVDHEIPELTPSEDGHSLFTYSSPEAEKKAKAAMKAHFKQEEKMDKKVTEMCKRLVEVRGFMWT